jgi:dihydroorotate dehydrogenase
MGFNNAGAEALARRLEGRPQHFIVGANIGKNKDTPNEEAVNDYASCLRTLHAYADYFVVNVSSPNTPGLRALQDGDSLRRILAELAHINHGMSSAPKPILLKLAPDLEFEQLEDAARIVAETGTAGLVATNTTISRQGLQTPPHQLEAVGAGGLSGKPLANRSTEVVRFLASFGLPVIGVGGIHSPADAHSKLEAGASLVQLYTGFIYEGPSLVKQILQRLAQEA